MSLSTAPAAPSRVIAWTRNSCGSASTVMVPGVSVIELACVTRPTGVSWLGLKRTRVGLMGSLGSTMMRTTVQPDLRISTSSQHQ